MIAMVQVIENRSVVLLTPLSALAPGPGEGWFSCRVRVDEAAEVEGYPNLLGATLPRELDALVPQAAAWVITVEQQVRAVACLAGPGRLRVEEAPLVDLPPSGPPPGELPPADPRPEVEGAGW